MIKVSYLPTDGEEDCFKRNIKNLHKKYSDMFRFNHHHQGAYYLILLQLLLLKQSESSVKIHRCGQFGGVAAYIIRYCLVYVCDTVRYNTYWLVYVCDTVRNKTYWLVTLSVTLFGIRLIGW
jgi:hypothetical protein